MEGHDSLRYTERPSGLGHVAARVLERVHDELELDLGESFLKAAMVPGARALRRLECRGQVICVDDAVVRENDRALDDILELADIARPRVGRQRIERGKISGGYRRGL